MAENNAKKIFTPLGASNHVNSPRQKDDFYSTDPKCVRELLTVEPTIYNVWEPACGQGHISKELKEAGLEVFSTDLIDRGYGQGEIDFLKQTSLWDGWIVTNPPYKLGLEFCQQALKLCPNVAMFLKLTFLESQKRYKFFQEHPPAIVYVYSSRRKCCKDGEDGEGTKGSSAIAFAWFVWKKERNNPDPVIKWIV